MALWNHMNYAIAIAQQNKVLKQKHAHDMKEFAEP